METRGRVLGNRYELLVPLASGGMGRVWRARDTLLERPVAVKVLRNEFTGDATFRARFRAEAQHTAGAARPAHRGRLRLRRAGGRRASAWPTSSWNWSRARRCRRLLEREGRLSPARTLDVLRQTAAALAAAHAAGVVHRDVKPGNVLVGNDGVVKITDFGIAWSASSVPLTGTGQVVGTAHYLSPEQAEGAKATPASDVYALGMVAYECLAGRRAFDGENSVQIALKQIREQPDPLPDDVPPPSAPWWSVRWPRTGGPLSRRRRAPGRGGGRGDVEPHRPDRAGRRVPTGTSARWVSSSPSRCGPDPPPGAGVRVARRPRRSWAWSRPRRSSRSWSARSPAAAERTRRPAAGGRDVLVVPVGDADRPATVDVGAADLVGRPVAEVQAELAPRTAGRSGPRGDRGRRAGTGDRGRPRGRARARDRRHGDRRRRARRGPGARPGEHGNGGNGNGTRQREGQGRERTEGHAAES